MPNELNWGARRRRAVYRAWRRGTKELDLLLGPFASWWVGELRENDGHAVASFEIFEALLDEKDTDIYDWIMGEPPSATYQSLIAQIRAFHEK